MLPAREVDDTSLPQVASATRPSYGLGLPYPGRPSLKVLPEFVGTAVVRQTLRESAAPPHPRPETASSSRAKSRRPSSVIGMALTPAPRGSAAICQGTMLL